uniref:Uncharacterized protein n=1 Tax=Timema shepardi TaxID=629360 RepID=A0A7R9G0U3_TIMSH|nr:unnamed protein product [Timema shepardi]
MVESWYTCSCTGAKIVKISALCVRDVSRKDHLIRCFRGEFQRSRSPSLPHFPPPMSLIPDPPPPPLHYYYYYYYNPAASWARNNRFFLSTTGGEALSPRQKMEILLRYFGDPGDKEIPPMLPFILHRGVQTMARKFRQRKIVLYRYRALMCVVLVAV